MTLVTCALASLHAGDAPGQTEWQLPNEKSRLSFADDAPIVFIGRNQNAAEWDRLPRTWNESKESAVNPATGLTVTRRVVKIKVPLGLTPPVIPSENPPTVAKWILGKRLFFDKVLSTNGTVSCSSCHEPAKGFTDQLRVSRGIGGRLGGMNTPTIINSAFNALQFWDGRSISLEDQAQAPVENRMEMSADAAGSAWTRTIGRIRRLDDYARQFPLAFGTPPTRDAVAKSIATYERTVLSGSSIVDRADAAARTRIDEYGGKAEPTASDYLSVLRAAVAKQDVNALESLGLTSGDEGTLVDEAESLARGRALFFGKARCNGCHGGENFTDNQFHNLGVQMKDGELLPGSLGRFRRLPTGHKNPDLIGAFKTPTLRALLSTAPYMHDGSEDTLERVVDFYDRGGTANAFLDSKLRDYDAERRFEQARAAGQQYVGPDAIVFAPSQRPIVPLKLGLSPQDKKDLVLYLKALQGDPIEDLISDPTVFPRFPGSSF